MKTTKLFKVLFITFFSIYFLKYAPVYADTNIKTLDLTAKTTVKDPYCKGVVYSFNLPAGGVNFRGMSGYVSMTPTEPIFTQTLIWAANLPNGDCPPSGSLLNREDGSTIYPQTDGAPWFAAYILKNSENKYVRLNTDFMLPKPIPMKGCVIVIVGGCGAVATEITSESHMKMLYDTEPFDKLSKPSLVPLSYEYGYGGGGGASGGANCSGSQCAFASVWKADKDYDLHFFHGGVAGSGFSPVADPPQGNWGADFDYYLYKNCDNLKQGINGPSDYYREIPADATPLFNLRQNVINNAPQTSIKDKISGFGGTGDLPVVGDWNGDGKTEIGNYKGNSVWVLDYDGSYVWDGASVDKIFSFGSSTDKPITGDWNGDGKTEIGNYKGNGMFALDQNGNGTWDGASVDKVFNFAIANPSSSDLPVVGDWDGDGKDEIGIYQPITKKWYLDYNGNGVWDAGNDKTYQFGGQGDLPVVGDWNGDGKTEIGNYKGNGMFALDQNGNGTWDGASVDKVFNFAIANPSSSDLPVVGDWDGDGKTEIGIYGNVIWMLDWNGNGIYDVTVSGTGSFVVPVFKRVSSIPIKAGNCIVSLNRVISPTGGAINVESQILAEIVPDIDETKFIFGGLGDKPITGDWNGDGKTEIGNYKGNGMFALDQNGNGTWDGASVDKVFNFAIANPSSSDLPVVGDWNGDGKDEIGIYQPITKKWYLDYNSNGVWDAGNDKTYQFGGQGDLPVVGDWDGDGKTEIGNYKGNGVWAVDYNGNGVWDAGNDKTYQFGGQGDLPVVGDWNGDGKTEIGNYKKNGNWALDDNGNGNWDGTSVDRVLNFGDSTDLPVTGDWNGDGKTEIGVYRSSTYLFYLAYKQNMVCVPKTCAMLGNYRCGSWDDGCGNTLNCGACASGKTCSAGQCVSNCSGRASKKCADGNLYWYNSCNTKEELAQSCVAEKKTCQNGACVISGGGSGGGGGIVEPEEPKQLTRAEIVVKIAEIKKLLIQLIIQLIAELQKQLAATQ